MSLDVVGNVLNGRFVLKAGISCYANINNNLTTSDDPNTTYMASCFVATFLKMRHYFAPDFNEIFISLI
jgi:hypothetical protein